MFRRTLLGAAIAATFSLTAAAADFSNTYFFGDSLTDSGSFAPFLPPGTGRFTTNPGPVWSENVAATLGTNATPATAGGNNFAQGGARVTLLPGVPETSALTAGALPVRDQVSAYLAGFGQADSNALYSVWAGANDIFRAIDASKPESANPVGYLVGTAGELVGEVARLQAAGARYILVSTVPDIGATPFGASLGPANAAAVTGLVGAYNQTLFGGLSAAGIKVIPLDTFTLLHEVIASPAAYGFVNVTVPACGATGSLVCTSADFVAPDADRTFLFADGVHPTTATHRIISDYALGVIEAPRAISLLAESPLQTRAALFATVYDQAAVGSWARPQAGRNLWVSAGGGRLKYTSSAAVPGASGNPYDVAVGVDTRLSPNLVVGAALGLSSVKPDFSVAGGNYKQEEQALALYAGYRRGPFHAAAVAAAGNIDYDTTRVVALGPASRSISGSTSGSNLSLGVLAGYDLSATELKHGPIVGLHSQRVRVDGFSENDSSSSGMSFGEQKRSSLVGSIGYQASYDLGRTLPYARLTLDHEFRKNERSVSASLATLPGNGFDLPAFAPDRTYGTAVLGVGAKFTPAVSGNLALTARFGQDNVRSYGLQAGISMGF